MAVDTLAFATRGVYDASGTPQWVLNVKFVSWGLLTLAFVPGGTKGNIWIPSIPTIPSVGRP